MFAHKYINTPGAKPTASECDIAEIVMNTADGTLWTKSHLGDIIQIGSRRDVGLIPFDYVKFRGDSGHALQATGLAGTSNGQLVAVGGATVSMMIRFVRDSIYERFITGGSFEMYKNADNTVSIFNSHISECRVNGEVFTLDSDTLPINEWFIFEIDVLPEYRLNYIMKDHQDRDKPHVDMAWIQVELGTGAVYGSYLTPPSEGFDGEYTLDYYGNNISTGGFKIISITDSDFDNGTDANYSRPTMPHWVTDPLTERVPLTGFMNTGPYTLVRVENSDGITANFPSGGNIKVRAYADSSQDNWFIGSGTDFYIGVNSNKQVFAAGSGYGEFSINGVVYAPGATVPDNVLDTWSDWKLEVNAGKSIGYLFGSNDGRHRSDAIISEVLIRDYADNTYDYYLVNSGQDNSTGVDNNYEVNLGNRGGKLEIHRGDYNCWTAMDTGGTFRRWVIGGLDVITITDDFTIVGDYTFNIKFRYASYHMGQFFVSSTSYQDFCVGVDTNGNMIGHLAGDTGEDTFATGVFTDGGIYEVTVARVGTTVTFYVDGVEVGTREDSTSFGIKYIGSRGLSGALSDSFWDVLLEVHTPGEEANKLLYRIDEAEGLDVINTHPDTVGNWKGMWDTSSGDRNRSLEYAQQGSYLDSIIGPEY